MGSGSLLRSLYHSKRAFVKALQKSLSPNRYSGLDRWIVKGVKTRVGAAMSVWLYDLNEFDVMSLVVVMLLPGTAFFDTHNTDLWQLTICVILGYIAASMVFTAMLYPAFLWDPEYSFAGEPPPGLGMLAAVFCMSLSALSQTAVNLTELAPASGYTISIVVMVHFVGVLMGAVLLGVLINKASIPSARVVFSDVCLLTSRNGEPVLILRIGNTRGNFLLNPEIRVGYLKIEATLEGENVMTMTRMELNEPPAMAPSINVTCKITPDNPLWGKTYHDLKAEGAAIYVALAATDNQHFQEVFARRFYLVQDIRLNCRFTDIMRTAPSGDRLVDFRGFNSVIQNTIMPVSFGLSFEETVAINGTVVAATSAHSSAARAKKGKAKRSKLETATRSGSEGATKSKESKKVSGVKKDGGDDTEGQEIHVEGKRNEQPEEDHSDMHGDSKEQERESRAWRGQAGSTLRMRSNSTLTKPNGAQGTPFAGGLVQGLADELKGGSQNTHTADDDTARNKASGKLGKSSGSFQKDRMHVDHSHGGELEEPEGNGETVSDATNHLRTHPTEQMHVQSGVFAMVDGSGELPAEEHCVAHKFGFKTISTVLSAFNVRAFNLEQEAVGRIRRQTAAGNRGDTGSHSGAGELFDTDASQELAGRGSQKWSSNPAAKKLISCGISEEDDVSDSSAEGSEKDLEGSDEEGSGCKPAGDDDVTGTRGGSSQELWRFQEGAPHSAALASQASPHASFSTPHVPEVPEALSKELPAHDEPDTMHAAHAHSTTHLPRNPKENATKRMHVHELQTGAQHTQHAQPPMEQAGVEKRSGYEGATLDPQHSERVANRSAHVERMPGLEAQAGSSENDEGSSNHRPGGLRNSGAKVLDPFASMERGQKTTPIATHIMQSHRVSTGGSSAADVGDSDVSTGAADSESDGESEDAIVESGSDEELDPDLPLPEEAEGESGGEKNSLEGAAGVATGSTSGGGFAAAPAAAGAAAAAAVRLAPAPPAQAGGGGGVAGAARVLLAARRWRRNVLTAPSVPSVPEDRALSMSISSVSDSMEREASSDSATPNAAAAVWSTLLARSNGDGGRELLSTTSMASRSSSESYDDAKND